MSIYFFVWMMLAAGSLMEWNYPKAKKAGYWICWAAMTGCLCFRFGQGTDYVTYQGIYETIPTVIDLSQGYICGFFPEIGWRLLSAAFKVVHAPFWVFTMVLGFAEMLLVDRFVRRFASGRIFGLFMLYPVLYLVYLISGLRQGLAMCLFLSLALPCLLERKWGWYVVSVLLAASFHRVGYAWLILIPVIYIPVKWVMALAGLAAAGGLFLQIGAVEQLIVRLVPIYHVKQFLLEGQVSWFALGERLVSATVLMLLYLWLKKEKKEISLETECLWKVYLCGVCAYLLLSSSSYYASRYGVIFKIAEGAVVIGLTKGSHHIQKAAAVFFFGLTCLMGIKNLNAMTVEGGYSQRGYQFWNCPYVSIFDQDEIEEHFRYEDRVRLIYDANIEDQELWRIK